MNRIIISFMLTLCFVSINAQHREKLDNMLSQLDSLGIKVRHKRSNNGRGYITESYNINKTFHESCIKDECPAGNILSYPANIAKQVNDRQHYDSYVETIRNTLEDLMPIAEESYHNESHNGGKDTISYSLCISSGNNSVKRNLGFHGSPQFFEAKESISFDVNRTPQPNCTTHHRAWSSFDYVRNEQLATQESVPFNWEEYHKSILPLLKQKGVKQRKFLWAQDNNPDYMKDRKLYDDYSNLMSVTTVEGKTTAGETTGIIYTIPCDKQDLAIALLEKLNSITEQYIEQHPEQIFTYEFDNKFNPCGKGFAEGYEASSQVLYAVPVNDYKECYRIRCAENAQGYHILVFKTKGVLWIPREWSKLKSIVNGKKTYVK